MNVQQRIQAVLEVCEGKDLAAVAAHYGVSESELEAWRQTFLAGARAGASRRPPVWRRFGLVVAALVALTVVTARTAWAQVSCASVLPSPMVTFCPDTPALASNINDNFRQLVAWVEGKVGPVGSATVTTPGNLVVTGTDFTLGNSGRGNAGRALVHDTGNRLSINFGGDFSGGTVVQGNLSSGAQTVNGNETVTGDLAVNTNVWGASAWQGQVSKGPSGGAQVNFGGTPGMGWSVSQCPTGQYVCGLAFTHPSGQDFTFQENFTIACCTL